MQGYNYCSCGIAIQKQSKKCIKCANKEKSGKNRPPDQTILAMLKTKSVAKVAKELGLGVSTIKAIIDKYGRK